MHETEGFTLWLTGLSGAGKTTVSRGVEKELRARGTERIEVLDGDVVRTNLSRGLTYSKEDRNINIRRIAFVCDLLTRNGVATIAAAISPYRETRLEARKTIGRFLEVYCKCPVEVLQQRDPKGLYRKAVEGELTNLTGVGDPYEEPEDADVVLETDRETPEESIQKVIDSLEGLGWIPPLEARDGYTEEEESAVQQRLADLGYI